MAYETLVAAAAIGIAVNSTILFNVFWLLAWSSAPWQPPGAPSDPLPTADCTLQQLVDEALAARSERWRGRCVWLARSRCFPCFSSRRLVTDQVPSPYAVVGRIMAGTLELIETLELSFSDIVAGL
jgi:hypothetical protein